MLNYRTLYWTVKPFTGYVTMACVSFFFLDVHKPHGCSRWVPILFVSGYAASDECTDEHAMKAAETEVFWHPQHFGSCILLQFPSRNMNTKFIISFCSLGGKKVCFSSSLIP